MRVSDLIGASLIGIAALAVVQATWAPATITLHEADDHIGQRVQTQGIVTEVRWYDDGGHGAIAADGALLHVRFHEPLLTEPGQHVAVAGTLQREDGLPLLDIDALTVTASPEAPLTSLSSIAARPDEHVQHVRSIRGDVQGSRLHDNGHAMRLLGDVPDGPATVTGTPIYHASCLCHALLVTSWTP